ncbi:MAG: dTMP kinase [Verrucomicrobiales bacterium]
MNEKPSYPGKLIAVEGLDGSGKSTQIYLVKRWLQSRHLKVFFTEWNSSSLVKDATRRGKQSHSLKPTTFSLIHATDFADRYERQILPLLRAGYIVLCDRYIFTAFARDRARGVEQEWVASVYDYAIEPDITFYFRVPLEVSLNRILRGRPELGYFEAGLDMGWTFDPYESFRIFQGKVFEVYEELTTRYGLTVIDAEKEIPDQQKEVRRIIKSHIDLNAYKHPYMPRLPLDLMFDSEAEMDQAADL